MNTHLIASHIIAIILIGPLYQMVWIALGGGREWWRCFCALTLGSVVFLLQLIQFPSRDTVHYEWMLRSFAYYLYGMFALRCIVFGLWAQSQWRKDPLTTARNQACASWIVAAEWIFLHVAGGWIYFIHVVGDGMGEPYRQLVY